MNIPDLPELKKAINDTLLIIRNNYVKNMVLVKPEHTNSYEDVVFYNENTYHDCITVGIPTNGSTGGTCWNEEGESEDYTLEKEDILEVFKAILASPFEHLFKILKLEDTQKEIINKFADNSIGHAIGEHVENEYYGNFTKRLVYAINTESFFKEILTPEQYSVFDDCYKEHNHNNMVEDKKKRINFWKQHEQYLENSVKYSSKPTKNKIK